MKFSFIQRSWW